ncbi:MAG: DsbA family protein [Paracoccaceae bacterium]
MAIKRRDLIVSGVVLLAVFGGIPALRRFNSSFQFDPVDGLEGFRRLGAGSMSAGSALFVGLDASNEDLSVERARIRQIPCRSIFGPQVASDGRLPIAVFSDYNCPYCAVLSERLIRLEESGVPIRLIWLELPRLGPRSERSAHAALAAAQQGNYVNAHRYLMARVLPPGSNGLRQMARNLDLNPDQLIADANSNVVARELRRARALASVFGVIGTPTTVVGRTIVVGSITYSDLIQLVELERSETELPCD